MEKVFQSSKVHPRLVNTAALTALPISSAGNCRHQGGQFVLSTSQ